jgi:hypothetical protein
MSVLTDTVNSESWLNSKKDLKLSAYIENLISVFPTLYEVSVEVPIDDFFMDSLLNSELQTWDSYSDEALFTFEKNLI